MGSLNLDSDSIKRRLIDPVRVAHALGLNEGAQRQRDGLTVLCPWHRERRPSCSVTVGPDGTLRSHCFGCGNGGDVFSLAGAAFGLDVNKEFARVMQELAARCGLDGSAPLPLPPRRLPPPRTPPPLSEVGTFVARCPSVCEDPALALALLNLRGLDPAKITDRDLARALPAGPLPGWARCGEKSWRDSRHTLIVPLWDEEGQLASVHARSLQPDADPKGLSPAGHSSAGLILACSFARQILTGGIPAWWHHSEPPTFIVAEGVPDFLTAGCHYGEWEFAPAVIGVISGAWSKEVAARIPNGSRVVIRTHSDEAGRKYRQQIAGSLHPRCRVEVGRHAC